MSTQLEINNILASSGNFSTALTVSGIPIAISTHTHTSSDITNFNSSVSGLLPVTSLSAGTGIYIGQNSTNFTINTTGLVVGTDIQAHDAGLQSISSLTTASDSYLYTTSLDTYTTGVITSFGRSLVDDSDASTARSTLGLGTAATLNSGVFALSSHTHSSSDITDFNSSVSGLLPVKDMVAGTGISISSTSGTYTINSTSSGGSSTTELIYTYAATSGLPASGDASKLYVVTDSNRIYRWIDNTNKYVETGPVGGGGLSWVTAPSTRDSSGTAGQVAYDSSYIYVATSGNTWRRAAIGWVEDQYWSSVTLLLRGDGTGATFIDSSSSPKTITAYGNATQSSTQSKFGGKSLYFDGTNSYLTLDSSVVTFTGDFTLECWVYLTSTQVYSPIFESRSAADYNNIVWGIYQVSSVLRPDFVNVGGEASRLTGTSTSISLNTWTHMALVRSGGVISSYIGGVKDSTTKTYSSTITPASATLNIGRTVDPSYFPGYLDDIRITAGVARYTSNFTPPTTAFTDY